MGVENLSLSWDNMMPIEECYRGIAVAYDAQLDLPWLTLSPNESGVVGRYLNPEMLSRVPASPML